MKFNLLLICAIIAYSMCSNYSERTVWMHLKSYGMTKECVAGFMGNLYAESGIRSDVYELNAHTDPRLTDLEYVNRVGSGQLDFVSDGIGFGVAQWKDRKRKQNLLDACRGRISDMVCQLTFIYKELSYDYAFLLDTLRSVRDVSECTQIVMLKYLNLGSNTAELNTRIQYAQGFYDRYA